MDSASDYIKHLPRVITKTPTGELSPFLGNFLKIFEAMLAGRNDANIAAKSFEGLEEIIDRYLNYLDPALVPMTAHLEDADELDSEFLAYLAGWVALVFDQNWPLERRREWLRRIVPLYKRRGTRDGIAEYLAMFVGNQARIDEPLGGLIIGEPSNATVGVDTFIADAPAYFFRVLINYGFASEPFDINVWRNLQIGTKTIVDLEKPAHTYYSLDARTPGFIVSVRSTIASDSLIWENSERV